MTNEIRELLGNADLVRGKTNRELCPKCWWHSCLEFTKPKTDMDCFNPSLIQQDGVYVEPCLYFEPADSKNRGRCEEVEL